MTTPLTPGVYVREAPGGARAIEAAPTAVTIFVGETERGRAGPVPISSPIQYQRLFGGYFRAEGATATRRLFMPDAVGGFFENGGPRAYVLRLVSGTPAVASISLVDGDPIAASAVIIEGANTATITARTPGATGNAIQVRIENAASGEDEEFNLRIGRTNAEGEFEERDTNSPLANLNAVEGDDDNLLTVLENDPDISWSGDVFRPANAQVQLSGGASSSALLRAIAGGVWGNQIHVAVTDSADGDAERFNLIVFYRPPGEQSFSEVERHQGLSAQAGDEKYVVDELARSNFVEWKGAPFRPANFGDPEIDPPGEPLSGGTGGDAAFPQAGYSGALALLDGIEDAAMIVCAADDLLNPATTAENYNALVNQVLAYVERRPQRDLFLVADAPRSNTDDPVGSAVTSARLINSNHVALYWPRIVVADPAGVGRNPTLAIPAAGHVAGVYGRIDGRRGVWKVAAGLEAVIAGAVALEFHVLDRHQERMNPHGLNALRTILGAGRVIWGGRTRQPTTEWRYINVRRTAMFLRKSIYNGIQWAVFEGNDERLWAALRESIGAFMEAQFRNGAFAGATSREAFFVKCDADTTTPDDQAAGIVNVQVGFAPLRPAEFVIVTLSQMTRR